MNHSRTPHTSFPLLVFARLTAPVASFLSFLDCTAATLMLATLQAAFARWIKGKPQETHSAPRPAPRDPTRSELPPSSGVCWLTRRLGADEVHSILQLLPLRSLAMASATCTQLRQDALHPTAGRFLAAAASSVDPCASSRGPTWIAAVMTPCPASSYTFDHFGLVPRTAPRQVRLQMLQSRVYRTHMPVCLRPGRTDYSRWAGKPLVDRVALMEIVHSCAKIRQMDLAGAVYNWPERTAVAMLTARTMRQVSYVREVVAGALWITNERVQIAVLSLPALTCLEIKFTSGRNRPEPGRLSPRAFACAQQLREVRLIDVLIPLRSIAALGALPDGVRTLRLSKFEPEDPCALYNEWGRLASAMRLDRLESLQLEVIDLSLTERSWLRRCFRSMPCLQRVRARRLGIHALLQGLLDAGAKALPALRIVQWSADCNEGEESILRPRPGMGSTCLANCCVAFPS